MHLLQLTARGMQFKLPQLSDPIDFITMFLHSFSEHHIFLVNQFVSGKCSLTTTTYVWYIQIFQTKITSYKGW
jgi:hypothetical protein